MLRNFSLFIFISFAIAIAIHNGIFKCYQTETNLCKEIYKSERNAKRKSFWSRNSSRSRQSKLKRKWKEDELTLLNIFLIPPKREFIVIYSQSHTIISHSKIWRQSTRLQGSYRFSLSTLFVLIHFIPLFLCSSGGKQHLHVKNYVSLLLKYVFVIFVYALENFMIFRSRC